MTWYVGQKIVCIDNVYEGFTRITNRPYIYTWKNTLVIGNVYTIGAIYNPDNPNNDIALKLVELMGRKGRGVPAILFKPLLEKETDISIFIDMLNKHNMEMVE